MTRQNLANKQSTRRRQRDLNIYYLSQSYIDLPKTTMRKNTNVQKSFTQTLNDVEESRDIAGFDMSYDDFRNLYREAWKQDFS